MNITEILKSIVDKWIREQVDANKDGHVSIEEILSKLIEIAKMLKV